MIYLLLFIYFFYIDVMALGGGLAIIPFLERLIRETGWISLSDLSNIIALAEITPGAIGVNMATYTGFMTAGFWGSMAATIGLVCPSIMIVCLVSRFWNKARSLAPVQSAFNAAKSAVVGLLLSVFISLFLLIFQSAGQIMFSSVKIGLFLLLTFLVFRFRLRPVFYLLGMAVLGIFLEL